MKASILKISAIALISLLTLGACSTSRQVAFRDDVYNNNAHAREVNYQSPDYYYDEGTQEEQYADDGYYAEDYSDEGYYDDYYADEYNDREYANRINRFYYNSPGMSYYDPWFDPWYGYSPWYGYGYGSGFGLGFGWGMGGWGLGWGS